MKAFNCLAAHLAAVVCLAGCGKDEMDYTRIVFEQSKLTVEEGGSAGFTIFGLRNNSEKVSYDLASNPLGLEFTVSDANVLEIAGPGMLKGRKQGYAILSCVSSNNPAFNCRCKVAVLNNEMYHLDTPFDASMAFHCYAKAGFDRQCFDIDSKGNIYSAFSKSNGKRGYLGIMRHGTDGKNSEEMVFYYAAHGDSFSIEEQGSDVYVWVPTFGSKSSDGTYGSAQMFCRVKFEPGAAYAPEDLADNCFYLKDATDLFIAHDKTSGNIAVMYPDKNVSGSYKVKVYTSESLLFSPMATKTTASMKRGGDFGPIKEETTGSVKVTVHDISNVAPVAEFSYKKSAVYGDKHIFQGFCYYGGACYFLCDKSERTTSARDMTVTKLALTGDIVSGPTHIKAADATSAIRSAGFCASPDYLEAEGILIKDDCMYLGALSWNSGSTCYNATFKLK